MKLFSSNNTQGLQKIIKNKILIDQVVKIVYAYASRFDNHENVQRKKLAQDKSKLLSWDLVHHYLNIGNRPFGSASWTVVEANCHFTK